MKNNPESPTPQQDANTELNPGVQALADLAGKMGESSSGGEFNEKGFNADGIHRETGTKYDPEGYDADGFDNTGVDREGFDRGGFGTDFRDREGYDVFGYDISGLDRNGFDRAGIHKDTNTKYNPKGYDCWGYNKNGIDQNGFNREGFNQHGYDKDGYDCWGYNRFGQKREKVYDEDGYDADGFDRNGADREGYNRRGYNKDGINRKGKNIREVWKYDKHGFDRYSGRHFFTGRTRDPHGFNAKGEYRGDLSARWVTFVDPKGFDIEGHNRVTDSDLDLRGFNFDGINAETGQKYDKYGFDTDGYYYDRTPRDNEPGTRFTTDENGIDCRGFAKDSDTNVRTGTRFDENGFDRAGFDENGLDMFGYDKEGFDKDGLDRGGFDRSGFNTSGMDKDGYDKDGFNKNGFDKEGYDRDGYDKSGRDRDGYNRKGLDWRGHTREFNARFNEYGVDENGYRMNGKLDEDVALAIEFAKSGARTRKEFADAKGMSESWVRIDLNRAREKCPKIDEIIGNLFETGKKSRVAALSNDCERFVDGKVNMDEFWQKHPKLNFSEVLGILMDNPDIIKQFSDKTIESLVLDSENIEKNLRIFGTSRYEVSKALKNAENVRKIYVKLSTDGTKEEIEKKRNNTKKIYDTIKYFSGYRNSNFNALLGSRQSYDGGKTWIKFNGEMLSQAMNALEKTGKLICVKTVEEYIVSHYKGETS